MQPGRELDKRVAEAMGWGDFWTDGTTLMGYSPEEYAMGIDAERVPVPYYSTDWAAAGAAWEWLSGLPRQDGLELRLGYTWIGNSMVPGVLYTDWQWEEERVLSAGKTFLHAIVLAVVDEVKVK